MTEKNELKDVFSKVKSGHSPIIPRRVANHEDHTSNILQGVKLRKVKVDPDEDEQKRIDDQIRVDLKRVAVGNTEHKKVETDHIVRNVEVDHPKQASHLDHKKQSGHLHSKRKEITLELESDEDESEKQLPGRKAVTQTVYTAVARSHNYF